MATRIIRKLAQLLDVDSAGLANGDVPTYDSGAGKFTMQASGAGATPDLATVLAQGADAGGVAITGLADPSGNQDADTKAARVAAISALSSVYQPVDSDLTAIAALTTTAFGRALLALADAAALRSAAGLGTAATSDTTAFDAAGAAAAAQAASQPVDSDLTAIAALATTAYGRGLLTLANAAAADWIPTTYLDVDGALAADSDTKIATQKATKTYVDAHAGGAISATDGTTTVNPASELDFGAGFTITDEGLGVAGIAFESTSVYDYVELDYSGSGGTFNVPNGSSGYATTTQILTASPVTLDGSTTICVEFYVASVEPDYSGFVLFELYDGTTFVEAIVNSTTPTVAATTGQTRWSGEGFARVYLTPSAGSHTYSVRAFSFTGTHNWIFAGTNSVGPDTDPHYAPGYLRIMPVLPPPIAIQGPQGPAGADGAGVTSKIYDYTVTGSAKASIDTNVDGVDAGLFATDGSLLEVWVMGRTDEAVKISTVDVTFNADTAADYDRAFVFTSSTGSTPTGSQAVGATSIQLQLAGSTCAAGVAGIVRMSIPAYADTTFFKIAELNAGVVDTTAASGNRGAGIEIAQLRSAAALTRIKIAPDTAGKNLMPGTRLIVYKRT